jgi:hypothetical protein
VARRSSKSGPSRLVTSPSKRGSGTSLLGDSIATSSYLFVFTSQRLLIASNGVRTYRIPGGAQGRKGASRMERPMFRVCLSLHVGSVLPMTTNHWPTTRLLIPLNACRRKNYYLPWECEDERHGYEKWVEFFILFVTGINRSFWQVPIRRVSEQYFQRLVLI